MKITKVSYERLFKLEAYENERIGLEAEVSDDEESFTALEKLKQQVYYMSTQYKTTLEIARKILRNPGKQMVNKHKWAQAYVNYETVLPYEEWANIAIGDGN